MLSVGEVVEQSAADEPATAVERPAPVVERAESKPESAPVVVFAER
jgi:hypothetical protein